MPRRFLRFSSRRFFLWCSLTFLMSLYFCFSVVRFDLDLVDFFGMVKNQEGVAAAAVGGGGRERCVAMRGAVGVGGALLRAKRGGGGLHEAFKASRACGCLAARRHDRAARSASGGISESRQKCRPTRRAPGGKKIDRRSIDALVSQKSVSIARVGQPYGRKVRPFHLCYCVSLPSPAE